MPILAQVKERVMGESRRCPLEITAFLLMNDADQPAGLLLEAQPHFESEKFCRLLPAALADGEARWFITNGELYVQFDNQGVWWLNPIHRQQELLHQLQYKAVVGKAIQEVSSPPSLMGACQILIQGEVPSAQERLQPYKSHQM